METLLLLPYYGSEYAGAEFAELESMRPYGFRLAFRRTRRARFFAPFYQ